MTENFRVLLRTFCLQSTIIGLKYFYIYPDLLSRLFWALNLFFASTFSCMITWLLYCRFLEMPTRITIENQFESVYNLPYPTITLCSPNQITVSSMEHFKKTLVNGNITIKIEEALPLLMGYYELSAEAILDVLVQFENILDINQYSIAEVMGKMPQSCDRFLKSCLLDGQHYECKELFQPIITSYGYCCAFNSQYYFNGKSVQVNRKFKNRTVKATGLRSALSLVTDYEPEDAMPDSLVNAGAIRIMLTDWTEYPVNYETFLVDTNGEAFLYLRATYTYCSDSVKALPFLSRKCYFQDETRLDIFKLYRNSDCELMCYMLAVFRTCNCWIFYMPHVRGDSICKPTKMDCIVGVKKNMTNWLKIEQCYCPRDCESRKYAADMTLGNFDAIPYIVESQNQFLGMKFNVSTSILKFLFSKPIYVKQKQETVISIMTLASNLGGVFGLFLGCSSISVLEILFHIYLGVRNYIKDKFDEPNRNTMSLSINRNIPSVIIDK